MARVSKGWGERSGSRQVCISSLDPKSEIFINLVVVVQHGVMDSRMGHAV